jgi:hypothetical protein
VVQANRLPYAVLKKKRKYCFLVNSKNGLI